MGKKEKSLMDFDKVGKKAYVPISTYRLQLNFNFPFKEAKKVIPYLHRLGIDAVYCSPYFVAEPNSLHGYNVVSFLSINPEIGSNKDYEVFCAHLKEKKMGHILDLVVNHMAVSCLNKWWSDVLQHGPASIYRDFFDINWNPIQKNLTNKVLLAILGEDFEVALKNGRISLSYQNGSFFIEASNQKLPLNPMTYPSILRFRLEDLKKKLKETHPDFIAFEKLSRFFNELPPPIDEKKPFDRHITVYNAKRRLNTLAKRRPEILQFIESNVAIFNDLEEPRHETLINQLLSLQNFLLAFWQEASHEINYRRFFEINHLVALRVDQEAIFKHVHRFVYKLIEEDKIQGIRIDHPDGFYDPNLFFKRLQLGFLSHKYKMFPGGEKEEDIIEKYQKFLDKEKISNKPPLFVVIEKILQLEESLPEDWNIHGTVGYEYLNLLNSLYVDNQNERAFDKIYRSYTKLEKAPDELLYEKKKQFFLIYMRSEIRNLSQKFYNCILEQEEKVHFTLQDLETALMELIASFSVYRTYITTQTTKVSKSDEDVILLAFKEVKKRQPELTPEVIGFLQKIFLLQDRKEGEKPYRDLILRFQQLSPAIFAKGFEDTFLYIYNRLISLNDVGGEPTKFGIPIEEFHEKNLERYAKWPHSMICTSTHDTKRSEDVRMRINVLSELPSKWEEKLHEWTTLNTKIHKNAGTLRVPDPNMEYFLYQTLIGIWPLEIKTQKDKELLFERVSEYLIKAVREAKVYTNWYSIHTEYEEGLIGFLKNIIEKPLTAPFWKSFLPFQQQISFWGMLNTLSAITLKVASPGVLDIYQGIDLWDYSLVDPDNRRPVDFALREELLENIENTKINPEVIQSWFSHLEDGMLKLYLLWSGLRYRKKYPDLFLKGKYVPLEVKGKHKKQLIAFMRTYEDIAIIALSGRFFSSLCPEMKYHPKVWEDTEVVFPKNLKNLKNIYTKQNIEMQNQYVGELLKDLPFGLFFRG